MRELSCLMRLIDDLAANRHYYQRSLATLPDILLIEIPAHFAGSGLALDRYYPVILESLAELHEFETFLCEPRDVPVPPALLDHRPSSLRAENIVFARYEPKALHWPWLLLCCWPRNYTALVPSHSEAFARGAYTVEAFTSAGEVDLAQAALLAALGPHEARYVRSVAGTVGNA
jgi:hypothetical protein